MGGSVAAVGSCMSAGFLPVVIACVAGVCGVNGIVLIGGCLPALFAPTPWHNLLIGKF